MKKILFPLMLLISANIFAGPQAALDDYYDGMKNYTNAGAYETSTRGGYFGGRYTEKNPLVASNLVDIRLPSASGGCGGIDIFGGSFSFINSDQLVATLRAVAANAKGYFFQIALNEVCSDCMTQMAKLQDSIQKLNQKMLDSCQIAQGITVNTASALGAKKLTTEQLELVGTEPTSAYFTGLAKDAGDVFLNTGGVAKSFFKDMTAADSKATAQVSLGATFYKAMAKSNAGLKAVYAGADKTTMELLLSYIGSPNVLSDGENKNSADLPGYLAAKDIAELLMGLRTPSTIKIYDCDDYDHSKYPDDICIITANQKHDMPINGLKAKVKPAFDNYIASFYPPNAQLSLEHKNITTSVGGNYGAKISTLIRCQDNGELARSFLNETFNAQTLNIVNSIFSRSLQAARQSLAFDTSDAKSEHEQMLSAKEKDWREAIEDLRVTYGIQDTIEHQFEAHKNKCEMPRNVLDDQSNKSST